MKYLLLLIFLLLVSFAGDHGKITGIIYDSQSKRPIENVNVFIARSTIGASSDSKGKFVINYVPPGRYTLILSHLSFQNQEILVDIRDDTELNYTFVLDPKLIQLPEVGITDEADDEWRDNMEIFRDALLGTSWFADGCEIMNPYYISFEENEDGKLFASSDVPIEIENRSLGYFIKYFLDHFEYHFDTTRYAGYPYFEEMSSELSEDSLIWNENRLEAYMGSLRHFLRALNDYHTLIVNDTLSSHNDDQFFAKHGFNVYLNKLKSSVYGRYWLREEVDVASLLAESGRPNELLLVCDDELEVEYFKEYQELNYDPQISYIKTHADSVYFDKRGRYHDGFMLETMGYMYKQRLAEMLPFEYEPTDSVIFNTDFR